MRALATRSQRLAVGIAVLTAAALGTVSANAASASGTSTVDDGPTTGTVTSTVEKGSIVKKEKGNGKPPKGAPFAVAYTPTENAPDDVNAANEDFAACMREQGQSVFPDFHASKDDEGRVRLQVKVTGGDFDPTSRSYEKAIKACGPVLEKAGITFPDPADLPPLPEPGKPGEEGPSLHTEKGSSDDGLPSLSNSVRSA
ncbi:hypothetical protein [Streptomyces fulvoviolaceus]|uniref:hypothetical protein n=1 Tax=Streptomyces fulvoviolaceus TaxID=285535 RepID=UPI0021C032A0|nr:hypothetical protein [Streptomyces fulvoviolaceus]MCT9080551.1 hypothetical protein [Streptomyces fulvoviolaceus]